MCSLVICCMWLFVFIYYRCCFCFDSKGCPIPEPAYLHLCFCVFGNDVSTHFKNSIIEMRRSSVPLRDVAVLCVFGNGATFESIWE